MVSQIQLGNIYSSGGKAVVGGSSSGIDTESLIKSLADAKRLPAVQIESRIEANTQKSTAFSTLQGILARFKDAANFLRNPPGVQNSKDNVFEYRTATIGSNTSVAGSSYFTATVQPGTVIQNYSISEITSLAKATKQSSSSFAIANADTKVVYAAATPSFFKAGTFAVNGADITLDEDDTLRDVAAKFNAVSAESGVGASVLQVGTGEFKLVFTATKTGELAEFDLGDPGDVSDPDDVFNDVAFSTTQIAANAEFKIDNIPITRQSNSIDDLISGVTINLKQKMEVGDTTTELDINIQPDTELAKAAIMNFVNVYNDFRFFVAEQTALSEDGLPSENAVLANSSSLRAVVSRISTELARSVSGITGSDPSRLADLGITFADYPGDETNPETKNILNVDEEKLSSALATKFSEVTKVFAFNTVSSSSNLQVFSRNNNLDVSEFSLNINQTGGIYEATYGSTTITLDATPLSGGGVTLRGPAGSALEGLVLIFSGSGDETVDVKMTQGISDRIFNEIENMMDEDDGLVATETKSLATANERLQKEITRIDAQVEKFREQLLQRFGALEAAISSMNTLLQSLQAQENARLSSG